MFELEEISLLKDVPFTTEYQISLPVNILQYELIDFFIYISDDGGGSIDTIECFIECSGKSEPANYDWARISIEKFDVNSNTYVLNDYIVRKIISRPTSFTVRCRAQGRLMTLGIKANTAGGIFSIAALRKRKSK